MGLIPCFEDTSSCLLTFPSSACGVTIAVMELQIARLYPLRQIWSCDECYPNTNHHQLFEGHQRHPVIEVYADQAPSPHLALFHGAGAVP